VLIDINKEVNNEYTIDINPAKISLKSVENATPENLQPFMNSTRDYVKSKTRVSNKTATLKDS